VRRERTRNRYFVGAGPFLGSAFVRVGPDGGAFTVSEGGRESPFDLHPRRLESNLSGGAWIEVPGYVARALLRESARERYAVKVRRKSGREVAP